VQVIGTAGHVDHGKSTLINRLTGINPDRLKEEQTREMSIELGFAWINLPNGEDIGIIDVPGHRDFIENMLSGIGGIDAALLVVAADEGVMPQTSEHLAILDLLQIPAGVVALTKIDLIDDPDWLDLVEADLSETLQETILADAPIARVSARSGEGLEELKLALQQVLQKQPHRPDLNRPRLPIDRVFTLPGFGTIVTGTLSDGVLSVGDSVEILPNQLTGRIRGLQTHKQAEERAQPGSRTAVNISGISVQKINRGDVLVHPGTIQTTTMMDVWCQILPGADAPLKHNTEVKLFLGAEEVITKVRVLGVKEVLPGEQAFLQLMLTKPVAALRQDRFIIRRPSPPATIGGGQVVDPLPDRRHKRFNTSRITELESLYAGTTEDIIEQTAIKLGAASFEMLAEKSGLEKTLAHQAIENLINHGVLMDLKDNKFLVTKNTFAQWTQKIENLIDHYHQEKPLHPGMSRELLKSQAAMEPKIYDALIDHLAENKVIIEEGATLRLYEHQVKFNDAQKAKITLLLNEFDRQPFSPPTFKQSTDLIGEELVSALINTQRLILLDEDVLFKPEIYEKMRSAVISHIKEKGSITLAELRDKFDTSRKYAVAVLENLDQTGITIRRGDQRELSRKFKNE
jgi:selenocysteine-specific elongation factor